MTACRACSRPGPRLVHLLGELRRQCDAELHLAVPTAAGRSRHVAAALEARHVDHDCGRGRAAPGSRAAARTARDRGCTLASALRHTRPLRGPGLPAVSGLMRACPASRLGLVTAVPALPNVHRIAAVAAGRPATQASHASVGPADATVPAANPLCRPAGPQLARGERPGGGAPSPHDAPRVQAHVRRRPLRDRSLHVPAY